MFHVPTGIERVTALVNPFVGTDLPGERASWWLSF